MAKIAGQVVPQAAARSVKKSPLAAAIRRLLLGGGMSMAIVSPVSAYAQASESLGDKNAGDQIDEISVTERQRSGYLADRASLSKLTEQLRDTPQSIDILSRQMLDDRASLSVNDALRTVPGITLGAGEFSWQGNNPNIRGFNARDDMYLDGIRDFGSYPRDTFNLEQIDVLLGPSSVLFGRGSAGGAINQVSKRPGLEPISSLALNLGSDATVRGTADVGRALPMFGDGAAFRLNLLAHESEVADRDGAKSQRLGIAPSVAFGLGTSSLLTLSYVRQVSDDRPDYGLPWVNGMPAEVPRQNFYGFDSDYLNSEADIVTVEFSRQATDNIALNAIARYARYARESRITEPLVLDPVPPGTALSEVSVFRYVFMGDSEESLLTGQLNVSMTFEGAGIHHAVAAGLEASEETSDPIFAFGIGAPSTNLLEPTSSDTFSATTTDPRIAADTTGKTLAAYAIDTLSFGDHWQLTLGGRWDRFDTDYQAVRYPGPPTPFNSGTESGTEAFAQVDDVFSYRTAIVYKPTPQLSGYLAASTAFNPSAQSLSFLTSGRGLGTGNVYLDPEENRSFELGLKTSLADDAAALEVALFQTTKVNARIPDPDNPGFNTLGGEQRIRGGSVDFSGAMTPRLNLSVGYVYLDSELVKGAAGQATGGALPNAPEHSLSVWANYQLTDMFDIGLGGRYVSDQLARLGGVAVPGYEMFDAMVRYRVTSKLTLKLNLTNIGDEYYYDQLHPWHIVPGPGFTGMLAINIDY